MKQANPDLYQVATAGYLQKLAYLRKFIKYWGTTTVNGREVLLNTNYYYPTWTQRDDFERWARLVGIWEDVKDPKMKGIRRAWLHLNPAKADVSVFTDDLIASNLDKVMDTVETELEVDVFIGPEVTGTSLARNRRTVSSLQISTPLTNQAGLEAEILSEFGYLWDNAIISSGTPNDVYKDVLTRYILRSAEVPYEVVEISSAMVETKVPIPVRDCDEDGCTTTTNYVSEYYKGYRVRVKIPVFNFEPGTDIVQMITADIASGGSSINVNNTLQVIGSLYAKVFSAQDDGDPGSIFSTLNSGYNQPTLNTNPQIWETMIGSSFETTQYLRVDFLENKDIPLKERIDLLNSLLDSDYREKSSDGGFFGTILAVFVFVVAVYFAPLTGGLSLSAALAAGGTTAVVALATALTVGALVLAVTTAVLYQVGAVELANSFAKFSKAVEPLVMIATIITMVNVVTNAVKGLANEGSKAAATEMAKQQLKDAGVNIAKELADEMGKALFDAMVDEIALDLVTEQFSSMVWAGVKDKFANLFTSKLTDITLENSLKVVNYVFEKVKENDLAQIKNEIADEKAKLEAYEKEQVQVNDLLMDINRGLYTPLANDMSMCANVYDKPYEWWATKYHTGCIQANTVSAMWLADKAK